ncbi:MAG: hypothetical protein AB8G05_20345 [Oligoflexales bacterium]
MSWTHKLVNGWGGDPGLLSLNETSGDFVLCDGGSLEELSDKQISRIQTFCFTHHHMDHSQGFQKWLRVRARHKNQMPWAQVLGPVGTLEAVLSHLQSYTWNLLEDDWFSFDVYEGHHSQEVTRTIVRFSGGVYIDFQEHHSAMPEGIQYVVLDHHIDVLAYRFELPDTFSYKKTDGLEPGAWLNLLKQKVHAKKWEHCIPSPKGYLPVRQLSEECLVPKNHSFAYLTDFCFSQENLQKLQVMAGSIGHVFCESSFPEQERSRALRVKHLTSYQSALIAYFLGAKDFCPFHVSPAFYEEETYRQAQVFFVALHGSSETLQSLVEEELYQVAQSTPV